MNEKQIAKKIAEDILKSHVGGIESFLKARASKKIVASRFIMYIFSIVYVAILGISTYSWLVIGEFPVELVQYASIAYGISFGAYCGKSGYENKAKIECDSRETG